MKKNVIREYNSRKYLPVVKLPDSAQERVSAVLKIIGSNKKVLDVGCGDGSIADLLRANGNKVDGIDISGPATRAARKKGFHVHEIDIEGVWPAEIKDYDAILAGEIIEHIYDTDHFIENLKKSLKKGGFVVVTTPNIAALGRRIFLLFGKSPLTETTLRSTDAGHIRYFTFSSLKKLLEEHGLKVTREFSTVVNFDYNGHLSSRIIAKIFPTLGSTVIAKAEKL